MTLLDWIVLCGTLAVIVAYGVYKTRSNTNMSAYLRGDNQMSWFTIGLSIMATQASAITFLSTPGQAYQDGMGFVQFYFGLPLAMIVISVFFLPIYYRLKVYTAYEYLEGRFDLKTRLLTALLFLVQRGLAAGITIYAPAIILSTLLGWDLNSTIFAVGLLVIIYTVSGGTRAVSITQKYQMGIIMGGMVVAFILILKKLPEDVSLTEALDIAGITGRMQIIDTSLNLESRYTLFSGLTGGLFLALSYFGTDQSQVQRYLGGRSLKESRIGLMFNGLLKVPMQFFILLVGIMVFVFFQFNRPPAFFNNPGRTHILHTEHAHGYLDLEMRFNQNFVEKKQALDDYRETENIRFKAATKIRIAELQKEQDKIREEIKNYIKDNKLKVESNDRDYIFLTFVINYLPHGIIGLLLSVILSASLSSTASELNALASTTMVDYFNRLTPKKYSDKQEVLYSKIITLIWGVLAISFALMASLYDNLIQLVNILGSLFYGTILGVFIVAFFLKKVRGKAVFIAATIGQASILLLHYLTVIGQVKLGYLWYNVIGCAIVVLVSLLLESLQNKNANGNQPLDVSE